MANTVRNKPGIENATLVEDNKTLDNMMEMYEKNKNRINTIVLVVLVVIVGYFGYDKLYMGPRETKAANSIAFAQRYFEADSLQRALNGDGQHLGFLKVMKKYSGTKTANMCNYYAGVCYLQMGDAKTAIKYLEKFDAHGSSLSYAANGALGDAYMETNNTSKAMSAYENAIGNKNDDKLTPMYLMRLGMVCEKANKTEDAKKYYQRVKDEFPLSEQARDIDRYLGHLGEHD